MSNGQAPLLADADHDEVVSQTRLLECRLGGPVVVHDLELDRTADGVTEDTLSGIYGRAYERATFVRPVGSALPEIKHVAHTNFCDIGWRVDPSGRAILVSVLDNLLKGASGQAVQNMNVMLGLPETTGLL